VEAGIPAHKGEPLLCQPLHIGSLDGAIVCGISIRRCGRPHLVESCIEMRGRKRLEMKDEWKNEGDKQIETERKSTLKRCNRKRKDNSSNHDTDRYQ
jgi:hypothetical protein